MSTGTKKPISDVMPVARHIVTKLEPYCERIEIAGSLRRGRDMIGDIEIVALPKRRKDMFGTELPHLETDLDMFLKDKLGDKLTKNGAKYKAFQYGQHKVDLFLPESAAHWGCVFMIRTGSHEFNMWVMNTQQRQAGVMFKDGLLRKQYTVELIPTAEEKDVFTALGMPVVPPRLRDGNGWLEAVGL